MFSTILSTECDVNLRIGKSWTAIDRMSVIWKSDLSANIKWEIFQAVTVSVLLYGSTTRILTKTQEIKLRENTVRRLED